MMAAPMAGAPAVGGDAAAEPTEFDLVLDSFPADKKIAVLKIVRELTGLGLKDAKDMVEKAPCTLKEGASKAECEEAQKKLEDAGAKVVQRAAGATMLLEEIEDLEELELELEEELLAARDTATLLDALRGPAPASVMRTGSPMMSADVDEVMEKLKSMTLLEASELVKAIEETFDVDASVGGGMMMAAPMAGGAVAGGTAGEAAAEKTEFDLVLDSFPADKKIAVLKIVREITGAGLKDAKDMVEKAPCTLKEGASQAECDEAKAKLEK